MEVLTSAQMKQVDKETIERFYPGLELMERAGKEVAEFILSTYGGQRLKAVIFAGPGNNGGDALVVARYLSSEGHSCSVHLLKTPDQFTIDSLKNYQRLIEFTKGDKNVREYSTTRPDWLRVIEKDLADATLIVDGLFGTGVTGALKGKAREVVSLINGVHLPIISIDVPSGVDGDTGAVPGEAVRATHTVTIGCPKLGLLFHPGKSCAGELVVADIGFPEEVVEAHSQRIFLLDVREASRRIPPRAPDAHKYKCGSLLLVSGSRAYTGAALLAGEAALRGGCGMVYIGVPEGVRDIIEAGVREAVTIPLPETPQGTIAGGALPALAPYMERADSIAVGPGLGRNAETDRFIHGLLSAARKPLVLDADGINAFVGKSEKLRGPACPVLVTPHTGELEKLLSERIPGKPLEKIEKTREVAQSFGIVVVHKGAPTIIASPGGKVLINQPGNSALATAGSGDVLTGLVGSFLAQGAGAEDAASVACYLHGRVGEIAARAEGIRGVVAGDLLRFSGEAMLELEEASRSGRPV